MEGERAVCKWPDPPASGETGAGDSANSFSMIGTLMYCRECYTKLDPADSSHNCPRCNLPFDPQKSRTYLRRPFPGAWQISWYVITTSLISLTAAYVISIFQSWRISGH